MVDRCDGGPTRAQEGLYIDMCDVIPSLGICIRNYAGKSINCTVNNTSINTSVSNTG